MKQEKRRDTPALFLLPQRLIQSLIVLNRFCLHFTLYCSV